MLNSISLFVGTGQCNANCAHCAGVPLRKYAPKADGIIDSHLFYKTLFRAYEEGCRRLTLSSSGEPTLSPSAVTETLLLILKSGWNFDPISLYSNGIRIGEDERFARTLSLWESLGLTTIYITVHNFDPVKNAKVYGIENYPSLELICSRIHRAGLKMRANVVLGKGIIETADEFADTVNKLLAIGTDYISAWPIRNVDDDKPDLELMPKEELDKIEEWTKNADDHRIRVLTSRDAYEKKEKLTLFPNGVLSNTWCN